MKYFCKILLLAIALRGILQYNPADALAGLYACNCSWWTQIEVMR